MLRLRSVAMTAAVALLALGGLGCYMTTYTLGPKDKAEVAKEYVGDWQIANPEGKKIVMTIRIFDEHQYYVHWSEDDKISRMAGFIVDVKGVQFAHLREIPDDGNLEEKYCIVRVALKDGKLNIRHLNEKFFDNDQIKSALELRKIIEDNLENAQMYDPMTIVGTRIAK